MFQVCADENNILKNGIAIVVSFYRFIWFYINKFNFNLRVELTLCVNIPLYRCDSVCSLF